MKFIARFPFIKSKTKNAIKSFEIFYGYKSSAHHFYEHPGNIYFPCNLKFISELLVDFNISIQNYHHKVN